MHELDVIKNACIKALNDDGESPNGMALFHEVVDPGSVLELVNIVQTTVTAHELETLTRLIRNLTEYVEAVPDDGKKAVQVDREELIRYAKHLYAVYAR
ncbi:hypothetical protein BH11PSE11_BH11PSE11_04190 [soil metagenome]